MEIPSILVLKNLVLPALLLFLDSKQSVAATTFTLKNNCPHTIWPATWTADNATQLNNQLSELLPNSTTTIPAPPAWSGRIWARTGCLSSRATCATGNSLPITIAEFALGDEKDFYDVSLINGYNIGIGVSANECKYAGCVGDLNEKCPAELRVEGADGETVGCRSACQAFGGADYCCTGTHSTAESCRPTRYSQLFKTVCPNAYSYVYDDSKNTYSCTAGSNYLITFCPSPSS